VKGDKELGQGPKAYKMPQADLDLRQLKPFKGGTFDN
jgi:hypothetical protein